MRKLILVFAALCILVGMLAGCGEPKPVDPHRVEDIDAGQDTEEWW